MTLRTKFETLYRDGKLVYVKFVKKDGSKREMLCQRDLTLEADVQGVVVHANPGVKRVVEYVPGGENRWRSVNLDALEEVKQVEKTF